MGAGAARTIALLGAMPQTRNRIRDIGSPTSPLPDNRNATRLSRKGGPSAPVY
jgi:hypothetical protein